MLPHTKLSKKKKKQHLPKAVGIHDCCVQVKVLEFKMTEDEVVRWHHQCNGHELGQTPGDGEGQGGLPCGSPWGRRESDTTWRLNNKMYMYGYVYTCV